MADEKKNAKKIVDDVKEIVEEEVKDAKVTPEVDDDSIGINIETEHIKADIDVDADGEIDVTINNHKFSFNVKGQDKVVKWFFLANGKVNKDRIGATTFAVLFALSKFGIL